MTYTLFEVSWEVCNKFGGIHTVIVTKAKTLVDRLGNNYICVGPWLLGESTDRLPFDAEPGHEELAESCRAKGVAIKVGRWRIPGRPRTILVGFSELIARKNDILAWLWERYRVDSLYGNWDYVEPILFGYAAGIVIEHWWREYVAPVRGRAVVQAHEWMTGTTQLYLKSHAPPVGTVFLTHATMLGRSLAAQGSLPHEGLNGRTPEAAANDLGVRAKHSLEGVAAREADVFSTVSAITAEEAELLHLRRAVPLLPNGVDPDVVDEVAGTATREEVRRKLIHLASGFLGENASSAAFIAIGGRYEVHNKGIDVLLAALALLNARPGRPIVLFVLVPAATSGVRNEVIERCRAAQPATGQPPLGITTHSLFDPDNDPVHRICRERGLTNAHGSRAKVIQMPVYLHGQDGLLDVPYEAALRAMDLSCFPSFYEPWGYTPVESLVLGVPTITTDCAGFGQWARNAGLGPEDGVILLDRMQKSDEQTAQDLCVLIEQFLGTKHEPGRIAEACRRSSRHVAWSELIVHYEKAFADALNAARWRPGGEIAQPTPPKVRIAVRPPTERRPHLVRFDVSATLPESLKDLERVAHNYWWCWDPEAPALFEELSPRMWEVVGHNPTAFLQRVFARDLTAKAADAEYLRRVRRVVARFDAYMRSTADSHVADDAGVLNRKRPIAYFCLEFGIHESLNLYGGGLGVLAGDHLKAASDLNLPLVAVGLFYRRGYLQQRMSADGEQHAMDASYDPRTLPLDLARDEQGNPIEIVLQTPTSDVTLQAWVAHVGRVPLYLLDADLGANHPEVRGIAHQLYPSNPEMRLRQEIVLGKGGIRLLARLGIVPSVLHLNEGHAAFAALERAGQLVHGERMTFDDARELVRATTVFTTHTPVPAGHDVFGEDLMRRYFSDVPVWLGLPWERFLELGAVEGEVGGQFNMTYLAMSLACFTNAVSQRHGEVSRALLKPYWRNLLENEVPVQQITNGVHLPTWTGPELARLVGEEGRPVRGEDFRMRAAELDLGALWKVRCDAKRRLVRELVGRAERSYLARHDTPRLLARIKEELERPALLVGFARRFAPYKRADLLFKDKERLARILGNDDRTVRLLFAGKAHPDDRAGRDILKQLFEFSRTEPFIGKVIFIENYDLAVAQQLVQGVDVWLNNPIRPLEASGTSGMKAAANGVLNLSILDGWWIEGYDGQNGWAVGREGASLDQEHEDQFDSAHLLYLLEEVVAPLYYERDAAGVPRRWLERVRRSLATIPPVFNTDRMLGEYRDAAYLPAARNFSELAADGFARAREMASEHQRLRRGFEGVKIVGVRMVDPSALKAGDILELKVEVEHAGLAPDDLDVQFVLGHLDGDVHTLQNMIVVPLRVRNATGTGTHDYEGTHLIQSSGTYGYGIRVCPRLAAPWDIALRNLVAWA